MKLSKKKGKAKKITKSSGKQSGLKKSKKKKSAIHIIVDGPNVLRDQLVVNSKKDIENAVGESKRFFILRKQLEEEYGVDPSVVTFVVSSATKYYVDDSSKLDKLQLSGDLIVSPAGENDDFYALSQAKEVNGLILSNDRYTDWIGRDSTLEGWLEEHRITYVWRAKDERFTFGENIKKINTS